MLTIDQIRERMGDRNISEVARRIGVTRVWLSYIVNGHCVPSPALQKKLSDYLLCVSQNDGAGDE